MLLIVVHKFKKMKRYYPILISRKGEIVALQHLKQPTKDAICPVIEIVDDSLEKRIKDKSGNVKIVYKDEFENFLKTHWSFFGNEIILDFSLVTEMEHRKETIEKLLRSLLKYGVNVIPSLQMNSNSDYGKLVKELIKEYQINVCWRTSENSGGFDRFKEAVDKFLPYIGLEPNKIILLVDIGYAKGDRFNTLGNLANTAINSLSQKAGDWYSVVVAASSFPENLGDFNKQHNPTKITRFEWEIWKKLKNDPKLSEIKYGDFGTKFPFYIEANFAGTISIKYTTKDHFVIYKGELTTDHEYGHKQYILHSAKLMKSNDYAGRDFSWGDKRIFEIGNQNHKEDNSKPGSPTIWVQISQNHHIELITSLL